MDLKSAFRRLVDLRNRADYGLRNSVAWRRPGLHFSNQSKKGMFDHLAENERRQAASRADDLIRRYHLAPFRDDSAVDNFLENLYYLDLLEKALASAGRQLPAEIEAADIGCSSWFYVQALHALLTWWNCPGQRKVNLNGYEADPYRLYADLYSRRDHAFAHIRRLKDAAYIPQPFRRQPGRFDLITMLFPFVFIDDALRWGLPSAMFDPAGLLAEVRASLKPGGLLIIVNQGEAEHRRQRVILEEAGFTVSAAYQHQGRFYEYEIERFVLVSRHE